MTQKDLELFFIIDLKKEETIKKMAYATCGRKEWKETVKYSLMS